MYIIKNGKRMHVEAVKTFVNIFKDLWPEENWIVHHKDGNKSNNKVSNLEIMTKGEHTSLHHRGKYKINIDWEYVKELRQQKMSIASIEVQLGVANGTLTVRCKKENGVPITSLV